MYFIAFNSALIFTQVFLMLFIGSEISHGKRGLSKAMKFSRKRLTDDELQRNLRSKLENFKEQLNAGGEELQDWSRIDPFVSYTETNYWYMNKDRDTATLVSTDKVSVIGLSNFNVETLGADIKAKTVKYHLRFPSLTMTGLYTMKIIGYTSTSYSRNVISNGKGHLTVEVKNYELEGSSRLKKKWLPISYKIYAVSLHSNRKPEVKAKLGDWNAINTQDNADDVEPAFGKYFFDHFGFTLCQTMNTVLENCLNGKAIRINHHKFFFKKKN